LHDQIKGHLQQRNQKYKSRVDQKRREVKFEVGDQDFSAYEEREIPEREVQQDEDEEDRTL
jgi:hypothetical protein